MSKVNWTAVDEAMTRAKLSLSGTDEQKIARLSKFFVDIPNERVAMCDNCGGVSDVEFGDACPFCGVGEEEAKDVDSEEVPPPKPEAPKPIAPTLLGVSTPAIELPGQIKTEADLDETVREALAHKAAAASQMWLLGSVLRRIQEQKAYTLRQKDGKAAYSTWNQFVEIELGISPSYSYRLIEVATKFSREDVDRIGPTKLHVVLHVPSSERPALMQAAEDGKSVRELKELAEKANEAAPPPSKSKATKPGKTGKKPQKAALPPLKSKVTIATLIGRVELLPLRKNGKTARLKIGEPLVVEEDLLNGVVQRYVVMNNEAGDVLLVVERTRRG